MSTPPTAAHEAGHAVAAYVLGRGDSIDFLELNEQGGRMKHLPGHLAFMPAFDAAVIALAGTAFAESVGVRHSDSEQDKEAAARVIVGGSNTHLARLERALEHVEGATRRLVSAERFRDLGLDLMRELRKRRWMSGEEVRLFLRARDPLHVDSPPARGVETLAPRGRWQGSRSAEWLSPPP